MLIIEYSNFITYDRFWSQCILDSELFWVEKSLVENVALKVQWITMRLDSRSILKQPFPICKFLFQRLLNVKRAKLRKQSNEQLLGRKSTELSKTYFWIKMHRISSGLKPVNAPVMQILLVLLYIKKNVFCIMYILLDNNAN